MRATVYEAALTSLSYDPPVALTPQAAAATPTAASALYSSTTAAAPKTMPTGTSPASTGLSSLHDPASQVQLSTSSTIAVPSAGSNANDPALTWSSELTSDQGDSATAVPDPTVYPPGSAATTVAVHESLSLTSQYAEPTWPTHLPSMNEDPTGSFAMQSSDNVATSQDALSVMMSALNTATRAQPVDISGTGTKANPGTDAVGPTQPTISPGDPSAPSGSPDAAGSLSVSMSDSVTNMASLIMQGMATAESLRQARSSFGSESLEPTITPSFAGLTLTDSIATDTILALGESGTVRSDLSNLLSLASIEGLSQTRSFDVPGTLPGVVTESSADGATELPSLTAVQSPALATFAPPPPNASEDPASSSGPIALTGPTSAAVASLSGRSAALAFFVLIAYVAFNVC